jgi:hypothetical protein
MEKEMVAGVALGLGTGREESSILVPAFMTRGEERVGSVAASLERMGKEAGKVLQASLMQILPVVSVKGSVDQTIKDAVWLGQVRGLVEVQVH